MTKSISEIFQELKDVESLAFCIERASSKFLPPSEAFRMEQQLKRIFVYYNVNKPLVPKIEAGDSKAAKDWVSYDKFSQVLVIHHKPVG